MPNVRRNVALAVLAMDGLYFCFVLFAPPGMFWALGGLVFCCTSLALLAFLTMTKTKALLAPWFLGAGILCALGGGYSVDGYGSYGLLFKVGTPIVILLHSWLTAKLAAEKKQ